MNDKILTLLGFASKAAKLSYGFDAVKTAIMQSKSKLVLIANDTSAKTRKEITFYASKFKTAVLDLSQYDMETLSHAVGRKCAVVSVNDSSFTDGLISAINVGRNLNDK